MQNLIHSLTSLSNRFQSLTLLFLRLILAYGFFNPAMKKLQSFPEIVIWFRENLHLPFPEINAYLATGTECVGVVLLALGLATRFISVPLMVIMVVAVTMVHWSNGFPAASGGFEVPLYYFLMLFVLLSHGAGKFSLDETLMKKWFGTK